MSEIEALNTAIAKRTGGRLLGEMTGDELSAAFASGPIMIRGGLVVDA